MICPNFSSPKIKQDFDELQSAVGENLAYYLWNKNNGNHLDLAPNGNKSELFNELLNLTGNRIDALKIKAKTFTQSFQQWLDQSDNIDKNGEPLLVNQTFYNGIETKYISKNNDLLDHYDNTEQLDKLKVSNPIKEIMENFEKYFPDLGYYNELQQKLVAQFVNDGKIRIDC